MQELLGVPPCLQLPWLVVLSLRALPLLQNLIIFLQKSHQPAQIWLAARLKSEHETTTAEALGILKKFVVWRGPLVEIKDLVPVAALN